MNERMTSLRFSVYVSNVEAGSLCRWKMRITAISWQIPLISSLAVLWNNGIQIVTVPVLIIAHLWSHASVILYRKSSFMIKRGNILAIFIFKIVVIGSPLKFGILWVLWVIPGLMDYWAAWKWDSWSCVVTAVYLTNLSVHMFWIVL